MSIGVRIPSYLQLEKKNRRNWTTNQPGIEPRMDAHQMSAEGQPIQLARSGAESSYGWPNHVK
jgi:hypothetical protein